MCVWRGVGAGSGGVRDGRAGVAMRRWTDADYGWGRRRRFSRCRCVVVVVVVEGRLALVLAAVLEPYRHDLGLSARTRVIQSRE